MFGGLLQIFLKGSKLAKGNLEQFNSHWPSLMTFWKKYNKCGREMTSICEFLLMQVGSPTCGILGLNGSWKSRPQQPSWGALAAVVPLYSEAPLRNGAVNNKMHLYTSRKKWEITQRTDEEKKRNARAQQNPGWGNINNAEALLVVGKRVRWSTRRPLHPSLAERS